MPKQIWLSAGCAFLSLVPGIMFAIGQADSYSEELDRASRMLFGQPQIEMVARITAGSLLLYAVLYAALILLRSEFPRWIMAVLTTLGVIVMVPVLPTLDAWVIGGTVAQIAATALLFTQPVTAWLRTARA